MLFEMLKELRKYMSSIYNLCNSIADLDLIFSFAQYSMRSGLVRPKFGQCLDIKNSRHPILNLINSTLPVANDIVSLIILCNQIHNYYKKFYIILKIYNIFLSKTK